MDLESSETQLAEYQDNFNIEILENSRKNYLNVYLQLVSPWPPPPLE